MRSSTGMFTLVFFLLTMQSRIYLKKLTSNVELELDFGKPSFKIQITEIFQGLEQRYRIFFFVDMDVGYYSFKNREACFFPKSPKLIENKYNCVFFSQEKFIAIHLKVQVLFTKLPYIREKKKT